MSSLPALSPSQAMTTVAFVDEVGHGLPRAAAEELAAAVAPEDRGFKYLLVSKPTYARRRAGGAAATLSRDESQRVVRLARIWAFAIEVWGDEPAARRFLTTPHMMLDARRPLDVVLSGEIGGKLVEEVLGRLAYGSAA
jgi:putative toxin-antitoxin system antitoxin component (TIGR02293 family)